MRIVPAEDHLAFRESFRIAAQSQADLQVVGEAASGRETFAVVESQRPDVLVLDLMLRDTDGVAVLTELKRRRINVRTILLARLGHPIFVQEAFRAGALGYALKEDSLGEVLSGIVRVGRGDRYISPRLGTQPVAGADRLGLLSGREREVFCRLLEGMSTKEIAAQLCVSDRTIHAHRLSINRKLGVHSPAQLTRLAAAQGLLPAA